MMREGISLPSEMYSAPEIQNSGSSLANKSELSGIQALTSSTEERGFVPTGEQIRSGDPDSWEDWVESKTAVLNLNSSLA